MTNIGSITPFHPLPRRYPPLVLVRAVLAMLIASLSGQWAAASQPTEPSLRSLADIRFPTDGKVDFARDVEPIFAAACVECHGPTKRKGGLRLDITAAALKGGKSGPLFVPGKSDESQIIERVKGEGQEQPMPLDRDPLPAECIRILAAWVDQGAMWPDDGKIEGPPPKELHWAFLKPERHEPPAAHNSNWPRNSIDQFVLAKLHEKHLEPSPEADRSTLIRRVTLDLTGLPPTLEEVDAFLADDSLDAFERVVDRLLASPRYGENFAREWLDLARYADSNGYEKDRPRTVWPFRDWVIDALNRDMPYDQFTIEQLAGDLLPNPTEAQLIATGFNRNTMMNEEDGVDAEEYRVNAVIDRANTTSSVWLGQTLGCAQCHDHKYDPYSQREYYRFFAFFNDGEEESRLEGSSAFHDISPKYTLIDKFEPQRLQVRQLEEAIKALPPDSPDIEQRKAELEELRKITPPAVKMLVMKDRAPPRDTKILLRGSFLSPGDSVEPGVPEVLGAITGSGRGNRETLARWIVSPDNPLASRVAANRIWGHHFGRGLVETSENLGSRGTPPSHPLLLDWLATELIRQHWSLKAMHRLVVTSATYRQSSDAAARVREVDPQNVYLSRGPRVRLDGEAIRDQALALGGLLSGKMGGPPVFPLQPDGTLQSPYSDNRWVTSQGEDAHRRSIYTYWKRGSPYPAFVTFDAPTRQVSCTRRPRTNTPLQALTTLNDPVYIEAARGLALQIVSLTAPDVESRIAYVVKTCLARPASPEEVSRLSQLFMQMRTHFKGAAGEATELIAGVQVPSPLAVDPAEFASWIVVSNVLLNLDEVLTRG